MKNHTVLLELHSPGYPFEVMHSIHLKTEAISSIIRQGMGLPASSITMFSGQRTGSCANGRKCEQVAIVQNVIVEPGYK